MIVDLWDGALADRAEALALNEITYRRLHLGARRVAARLQTLGLAAGDRICIYSENRLGFVYAFLAALRLGAIAVPANVLYRRNDLAHLLRDARPAIVIVSPSVVAEFTQAQVHCRSVDISQIEAWADDETIHPIPVLSRQADEIALIVYTSGTTGRSKGAMLSHGALAAIAAQLISTWRWQADDTLLLSLPLFHIHGLVAGLTCALAAGARTVLHERFDAQRVLATFESERVSMFFGVPTMYARLLEHAGSRTYAPLRLFVCGSAALSPAIHRAFYERFGSSILERYGATEFGFALGNRYGGPRIAGSVGIPFPGVRVRVVAPGGMPLPPGETGELLVAGPNLFSGYWERPEATAAALIVDETGTSWYRSGDLAHYDTEHDVYRIVGRAKELIITGGFNVYPREVEEAIEAWSNVRACAVVGRPDDLRGEVPVAFLEAAPFETAGLLADLRSRLASFKIPKEFYILDALPRNAMGKVDKPALRARLSAP